MRGDIVILDLKRADMTFGEVLQYMHSWRLRYPDLDVRLDGEDCCIKVVMHR